MQYAVGHYGFLRRKYLSARLAVVYFALPSCGFAILILGIIGVYGLAMQRMARNR